MRPYSAIHTITTTATREVQVLARTKSIWFTVGLLIVAILALVGFLTWQSNKEDEEFAPLAVVGVPTATFDGSTFEARETSDRAEAEQLVKDGDVDAAVVVTPQGWDVLEDGSASISTMSQVSEIASRYSNIQALDTLGITLEQYDSAVPNVSVNPVDISAEADRSEADFTRLLTAFIALAIILFTVFLFAVNVGGRVTAEKSSRVVELVLASVRPLDFLAGKILGNVIFGFVVTALIIGTGAAALAVSGLLEDFDFSWSIFPVMLISWLLAMLFFSALYAAAGALVQRVEDLQSTQTPILFLLIVSMYVPIFGWLNTSATWMQVMSWIPPVSIFTAPISYAAGDFTALQLLGSFAIALVATLAVMWLAARIYRNSILNNGRKMSWIKALKS